MALSILDGNQTATTLSTILTDGAHIPAHTVVSLGSQAITDISGAFPATQTVAGTVTANVVGKILGVSDPLQTNGSGAVKASLVADSQTQVCDDDGNSYTIANPFPVSGTVTANVGGTVNANIRDGSGNNLTSTSIGGLNRLNVTLSSAGSTGTTAPAIANLYGGTDGTNLRAISVDSSGRSVVTVANFPSVQSVSLASTTVTVSSLPASTVTVSALPSGALTTRFGSVVTANQSFITSAVTNTSRKYLLAQNISAATVTIGIGFSPTTTQGIQLTSGAGLTFDAFCPTGAVFWLGAVTGAAFTILEG